MAKSDSHAAGAQKSVTTKGDNNKQTTIFYKKRKSIGKKSGLASHSKSSIFPLVGLNSWLAVGFLIISLGHSIWPRSGILAVSGLSLARKGVDLDQLQGYDDQMIENQSNLEKEMLAEQELEELANTNFDWERSIRAKRTPRYDFSAKAATQEDLKFIEQVSAECMFNPQLCKVLANIVTAELDYMQSYRDNRMIDGLEDMLSRQIRSPEGDMKRMMAQTRQLRDKQYMRRFGKNGNNRYGMKFRRM